MEDEKYVVFKQEDIEKFAESFLAVYRLYALDDAVVIRTQDVFAEGGLGAYAMNMQTGVDLNPLLKERLEPKILYFLTRAHEARVKRDYGQAKIPD